jgi:hypothetical protein
MERMAKELREVKSYSYISSFKTTWIQEDGKHITIWKGDGPTYWLAPNACSSEMKIVKIEETTPAGNQTEEILEHFIEAFPAEKLGIFIDYKRKTFVRLPFEPLGSPTYPLDMLRMIRENSGEVTRDLGTKKIQGQNAHGFVMTLKGSHESRKFDPVEVWVDTATDLPLEVISEKKTTDTTYLLRLADFRWNIDLKPKLFEPTPPEGYVDITPPSDEKSLGKIAQVLQLYAELSGGHYPRVAGFDATAIHDEMLKMAGFVGSPQSDWAHNRKYLQIQQVAFGLDLIAKILRNKYHSGYQGLKVGPENKDQVLLWWTLWAPERYRVFYGDLRTEILTQAEGAKLGLNETTPETAEDGRAAAEKRP